jgi:hypothetical protein
MRGLKKGYLRLVQISKELRIENLEFRMGILNFEYGILFYSKFQIH